MSRQRSGIAARAVGSLFILPFAAGLLIWPYGTLPLTALLIVLAAREGAQIVGAISGGASAAWSAALLVGPLAAIVAVGPVEAVACWVLTLLALIALQLTRALRVKRGSVAPYARSLFGTVATAVWLSPLLLLPLFGYARGETPAPWIAWLLAVVWSADTGAYLIGRRFGRRKLAPLISYTPLGHVSWFRALSALTSHVHVPLDMLPTLAMSTFPSLTSRPPFLCECVYVYMYMYIYTCMYVHMCYFQE